MDLRWARVDAALLLLALATVAVVVQHPHWNIETGRAYGFPVHLDEHYHWGLSTAIQRTGELAFDDPFSGAGGEFSVRSTLHERGFHAYWAVLQEATGIDWLLLFALAPTAIALYLGLALFVLVRRWGAGSSAALWVAAIPTSLRFLGPGFLVPIAFALPLVVAGMFALFHLRGAASILCFSLIAAALWPIHAMGAIALVAVGAVYAASVVARAPLVALGWVVAAMVPFLAAWPYYSPLFFAPLDPAELPASIEVVRAGGPWLFVFAALGVLLLALSRRPGQRKVAVTLAAVALPLLAVLVFRVETGRDVLRLYDRSVLVLFVILAIAAGAGTARLVTAARSMERARGVALVGLALILVVQAASVLHAARAQMRQDYYEVLTQEDYDAYVQAAAQLGPEHRRAIVDGLSTMAFSTITGIPTLWVATPADPTPPPEVSSFFGDGANDTYFLLSTGTTVVVTHGAVENTDLVVVAPGVYALREDYVARLPR